MSEFKTKFEINIEIPLVGTWYIGYPNKQDVVATLNEGGDLIFRGKGDIRVFDDEYLKEIDKFYEPNTYTEISDGRISDAIVQTLSMYYCTPWHKNRISIRRVIIDSNNIKPTNTMFLFNQFPRCIAYIGLEKLDMSNCTSLAGMFFSNTSISQIDGISNWDIRQVKNISYMFTGCWNLKALELNWNTRQVEHMDSMFCFCVSMTNLSISSFKLDNCITMAYMFSGCARNSASHTIKFMDFIAPKLTNVEGLFSLMTLHEDLDLTSLDCPNLRNFSKMFYASAIYKDIINLEKFKFNQFNTILDGMFSNASLSISILKKVETWNVSNVISTFEMFYSIRSNPSDSYIELNLGQWKFNDLQRCERMFAELPKVSKINLSNLTITNYMNCQEIFYNTSLTEINIGSLDSKYIINASYMFANNPNLKTIILKANSKYENVVSSAYMFANCPLLANIDVLHIIENSLYNLNYKFMYAGCTKLKFEKNLILHITIKPNMEPNCLESVFEKFNMVENSKPIYIIFHSDNVINLDYDENISLLNFASNVSSNFKLYVGWDKCTYNIAKYLVDTFDNIDYYGLYDSFKEELLFSGTSNSIYIEASSTPITINEAWFKEENNLGRFGPITFTNDNITSIKIKPNNNEKCIILNENLNFLFYNLQHLERIENFNLLSFPNIKSTVHMFTNISISELDLTNIDMTYVEDARFMLGYLTDRFTGIDTTKLNISNWSPKHLKYATGLFTESDMTRIDVKLPDFSTWDMSNCEDTASMFYKTVFNDLDLSSWDMSSVKNAGWMFKDCIIKGTLNISNWNLASVEDISFMFEGCSINHLVMDNFQITSPNVFNIWWMFKNANIGIDKLVLPDFFKNTISGEYLLDTQGLFEGLKGVKVLDISGWNLLTVKTAIDLYNPLIFNFDSMFKNTDLERIIGFETWKFNIDYANFNISNMFSGSSRLKEINGLQYGMFNITTSNNSFFNCSLLEKVSLPIMTNNTNSISMFENCYNLKIINIPYFNHPEKSMFKNCYNLTGEVSFVLDSLMPDSTEMFKNTNKDSNNNLIISYAFAEDYDIPTKDNILKNLVKSIENPETDKITMKLLRTKEFDISGDIESNIQIKIDFRTKRSYISGTGTIVNGLNMSNIKYYITYLVIKNKGIYLNVNSTGLFAYGMNNIIGLEFLDTSKCVYMSNILATIQVKELDVSMWNVDNVIDISGIFSRSALEKINISNWNTSKCKYINSAFLDCNKLKEIIGINDIDVSNIIYASYTFAGCSSLIKLNLSSWKTSNMVVASEMFFNCNNLVELKLDNIDFTNTIEAIEFLAYCSLLRKIDLSSININKCSNFSNFCYGCDSLEEIDLSNMQTFVSPTDLIKFSSSFTDCYKLKSINLRNYTFEYSNLISTFKNCYELKEVIMNNGFIVKTMTDGVFENCYKINTFITMYDVSFINRAEKLFLEAAIRENSQIIINYPFIVENDISNFININKSIESRVYKGNRIDKYNHGGYIPINHEEIINNISNPYYTYTDNGTLLLSDYIDPYYMDTDEIYKNMGNTILNKINNISIINLKSTFDNQSLSGFLDEPSKYSYELNKVDNFSISNDVNNINSFFKNSTVKEIPSESFIFSNNINNVSEIFMNCIQLKNAMEFKYDLDKELNMYNSYYNCITINTLDNYRMSNKLFSVKEMEYPEISDLPELPMRPTNPPREYLEYSHEPDIIKYLKEGFRSITDENLFIDSDSTGKFMYIGTDNSIILSKDFKGKEITILSHEFPINTISQLVIPNTITKFNKLYNDQLLTKIILPNSITYIGDNALQNNLLVNIIIPPNVTYLGHHAFANNKITNVIIPSKVTFIGADIFIDNSISSLIISEGVTDINNQAFRSINLANLSLPNTILYIRNETFQNNKLTRLNLPIGLTTIGYDAFSNNLITSINIPNSVTSIDERAFMTNKLTNATLPNTISVINRLVFSDNLITNINIPNSVISINESAFMTNRLSTLVIPKDVTEIKDQAFNNNQLRQIEFLGEIPPIFATSWIEKNIQEDGSKPIIQILVPRVAYKAYVKALADKLPTDEHYSIAVIVDINEEINEVYNKYSCESKIQENLINKLEIRATNKTASTHYIYSFLYEKYFGNCYELNGSIILDFDLSNVDPNFSLLKYSNEISSIFNNSALYGKLVLNYTKRFEPYIDDFIYCIYCHPTLTPFGNIVKGVLVN